MPSNPIYVLSQYTDAQGRRAVGYDAYCREYQDRNYTNGPTPSHNPANCQYFDNHGRRSVGYNAYRKEYEDRQCCVGRKAGDQEDVYSFSKYDNEFGFWHIFRLGHRHDSNPMLKIKPKSKSEPKPEPQPKDKSASKPGLSSK